MRALKLMLLILTSGAVCLAGDYGREIRGPLQKVRADIAPNGLPLLEGNSPGYPGRFGAFFLWYPKIAGDATTQDVELMVVDQNPVVRLIGAKIVISRGLDPLLIDRLSKDNARLWVGPFHHREQAFYEMTVAQVLDEIRSDPLFESRIDYGESVRVDSIKEIGTPAGSVLVLGRLPVYPVELARAGVGGEIAVRIEFSTSSAKAIIEILHSSHRELDEPTIRALSTWELKGASGAIDFSRPREFECHVVFAAND